MAALSIGNAPAVFAVLLAPRVGVWTADVELATDADVTGRVSIVAETGETWSGTVVSGGVSGGTWRGRIVGGAGGLRGEIGPTSYVNGTLGDVLADAARDAGEVVAPGVDLSAWALGRFVRVQRPAARVVADVARAAGLPWRVTRAGEVWVGTETWSALALGEVAVLEESPVERRYVLGGEVFALVPGVTVALPLEAGISSVQVDTVELRLSGSDVTATVWAHG